MSIFLGARLGYSGIGGNLPSGTADNGGAPTTVDGTSIGDVAGAGGQVGIEAAFRFVRILYLSVTGDLAGYSGKANTTQSMTTGILAGHFGLLTNPDGLGFFGDLGVGGRYLDVKGAAKSASLVNDVNYNGIDYIIRLGLHFRAGKYIRLIPQTEIDFGGSSVAKASLNAGDATVDTFTGDSSGHLSVFLGLGGYFDIELDKGSGKPAASSGTAGK